MYKFALQFRSHSSTYSNVAGPLMKIDQSTVAIITGSASGIGRALAARLAREGASLAIADINANGLNETAQMVRMIDGAGIKVTTHAFDVADREAFAAFANEVMHEHGRANLIINNAGVGMAGTAEELSIDDIEWLMGINFWGVVYGVKYFLPILREQPVAHIVNVSSVFGLVAPVGHSAYAASKFAVRGFTESLRHELAGSNVKVSVVHPGGVKTPIARRARLGAGAAPSALAEEIKRFETAARTTPEAAAERIVRGILKDEERILIGADAWTIDRIQRWMPVKYWRVLGRMIELMAK
jgi:NAD(P)-dependent dehydrogenase (short-subunit alcohol dehydrogenase family)